MAMGSLNKAVFMGYAQVVAAVDQAVVSAEGVIARVDVSAETAVAIPAGGRQSVGRQLSRPPTAGSQGVLQPLGQSDKNFAALHHLRVALTAPG